MNQERIGKFIAERRKEMGLTQSALAEKLGVTEKSVGNWENGRNMPDLSLFKPLCDILEISINDLMSGEKVDDKEYINTLEENIVNMVFDIKRKKKARKKVLMVLFGILIVVFFVSRCIYIYYEEDIEYDSRIMKCNIIENELLFYINGQSLLNTDYTIREIDNKEVYFFHSKINLYNKKYSEWEIHESMASLLEEGKSRYGVGWQLDLHSKNVEVYYTDKSIKTIEKANTKELEEIIEKSYFMCSTNNS